MLNDHAAKVRQRYGRLAVAGSSCCDAPAAAPYSPEELASLPEGAYLALGTGHPVRAADLKPGEVALDLGSGAGVDVLLAAKRVGPQGRAIGVDFTREMVERARANARAAGAANAEFHEAPIEALPLADASVDAITSNCVVNLSADKPRVLREAFRVLKPGGRLVVSDTLRLFGPAPGGAPSCDCISGAMSAGEWKRVLRAAGFADASVALEKQDACCSTGDVGAAMIRAVKPPLIRS
jgi:arsenite methyltransferase